MPYSTRAKALTFGAGVSLAAAAETANYFLKQIPRWRTVPFLLGAAAYSSTAAYSVIKNYAGRGEVEVLEKCCNDLDGKITALLSRARVQKSDLLGVTIPDLPVIEEKIYFNRKSYAILILILSIVVVLDLVNMTYEGTENLYLQSKYSTAISSFIFVCAHVAMAHHIGQQRDLLKRKYGEYVTALEGISRHIVDKKAREIARLKKDKMNQTQENEVLRREKALLEKQVRTLRFEKKESQPKTQASSERSQFQPENQEERTQTTRSDFFDSRASAAAAATDIILQKDGQSSHPSF